MNKNIKTKKMLSVLLVLLIVSMPVDAYEHAEDLIKIQEEQDAKLIQTIKIFRRFEDGTNNEKIEQIIKKLISDDEKHRINSKLAHEIEKVERMHEELNAEDETQARKREQENNHVGAYDLKSGQIRSGIWRDGVFYDLEDGERYRGLYGAIERGK